MLKSVLQHYILITIISIFFQFNSELKWEALEMILGKEFFDNFQY